MSKQKELVESVERLKQVETRLGVIREEYRDITSDLDRERKELKNRVSELKGEILSDPEELDNLDWGVSVIDGYDFEVVNKDAVDKRFWIIDEVAVRKELRASQWTKRLDGIQIVAKKSLRIN